MTDVWIDIAFRYDGPKLTYGPESGDHLAGIVMSLKSATGGFSNYEEVAGDHYQIHFSLPAAAGELMRVAPDRFLATSGLPFWRDKLKLQDLSVTEVTAA